MDDPVTAAAKVIYAAGHHYRWPGFEKAFEELDPIGRSEFEGIVEEALAAADAARAHGGSRTNPEEARAAAERIRARAKKLGLKVTIDEIKAWRDEGRR